MFKRLLVSILLAAAIPLAYVSQAQAAAIVCGGAPSKTLSAGTSIGATSVSINNATGLCAVAAPNVGMARIVAEGANTAESFCYTRSSTTLTVVSGIVGCPSTLASAHASGATILFDIISPAFLNRLADDVNGGTTVAHSATGTLTCNANTTNVATATSAITLTVPDGTFEGQMCNVEIAQASTNLASLSGKIETTSAATKIMWKGEASGLRWNGTFWRKERGVSLSMSACMYLTATLGTTVNGAWTQVLIDATESDNTGLMANIGANKITLLRPAPHLISFQVAHQFGAGSTNALVMGGRFKQGSTVRAESGNELNNSSALTRPGGTKLIVGAAAQDITLEYFNGANGGDTTPDIGGGLDMTYICAVEQPAW